ncbi:cryptochrome/photolyase family protein [Saccharospirillum impatiens]|uniref:cryptochrome/photolyase family protein n=1 Tax=Saccharospirillum impatiens TaxID=169438 RepID=UPI0003FD8634|nr:cryptochrome/photolyase family protein [Saccharospirillum impatiens]
MHLGLILGDQLSRTLPTFRRLNRERDIIVMAEVWAEARYVAHHRQKLFNCFSAMRHFAEELETAGWQVRYLPLDGDTAFASLQAAVDAVKNEYSIDRIVLTEPGEQRLLSEMANWESHFNCPVELLEDTRFLMSLADFAHWAQGRKALRMEYFYRLMRQRTGLLMNEENQPEGGQWNYDADNRRAWRGEPSAPEPMLFEPDSIDQNVATMIEQLFPDGWGDVQPGLWPVARRQAQASLTHAVSHLSHFGDFQDAMASDEPWLFHSRLSSALNQGLLTPMEVCEAVADAYYRDRIPINAAEGFIRQIIGWREYVRGMYWYLRLFEPQNSLNHHNALPDYFWTADTRMQCVQQSVRQTRALGYAHHIQRLMVTGNFSLIAGLDPEAVSEWYLGVYVDAYQWVERPNTLGMALHADGGRMTSKPYAASGQYINRQSNYCKTCWYNVKETTGSRACPFNGLYWHFLMRHQDRFRSNGRMGLMYRNLDKKSSAEREALWQQGENIIARLPLL